MTVSVIIVTLDRPECIRHCLECLEAQQPSPDQIIVVDASADGLTRAVVSRFPAVLYLHTDAGYGHMTASRNLGLRHATGDVVAFLDDDAYARPGWLESLVAPYPDATVGGVGGRALRGQPGEEQLGVDCIGRLTRWGEIVGNFAADPGRQMDVDHIIGCNMSWRREVLERLGGSREWYTGTEVREETDIALRVRRLGYRVVFEPRAVVDHVGAPQVGGPRHGARYCYYAVRNHLVLLAANYGMVHPTFVQYTLSFPFRRAVELLRPNRGSAAVLAGNLGGFVAGMAAALTISIRRAPNQRNARSRGQSAVPAKWRG